MVPERRRVYRDSDKLSTDMNDAEMNDAACGGTPRETGVSRLFCVARTVDKSERIVSSVPVCEYACVAAEAFLQPRDPDPEQSEGEGSTRRATDRVGIAALVCPASAASVTSRNKPGLCR